MKKVCTVIIAVILIVSGMTGCGANGKTSGESAAADTQSQLLPKPPSGYMGTPCRIAVVDIDPYEPASQVFYHFIDRLRELGWISLDEMPFDESEEIKNMVTILASMDLGGLVKFDEDLCYYMLYDDMGEIETSLKNAAESNEGLGLILAMGTDPGLFVKDMDLEVPLLVPMATDPVASGIIESAEESGDPNIWALVEPNPMSRQLKYYNNMIGMKRLGMVVEKDSQDIAAIDVYERAAKEMGVEVIKKEISALQRSENQEAYYKKLSLEYGDLAANDGIDAFILTIDVIDDPAYCSDLFQPFYEAGIPVLVSDGDVFVEYGGLLCVSSYDYRGYGEFTAEIGATVLNGKDAGTLPCEYLSSPHIVLNLDTAKKIDFPLDFKLLQSCDTLYSGKGGDSDGK